MGWFNQFCGEKIAVGKKLVCQPAQYSELDMKAFPNEFKSAGMDLRDYFAAKAMQGLLSSDVHASIKEFAEQAYIMADAMMKARNV